ncbi:MAG: rhodanese-like domain-containing protein [Candidatus Omnitrophota bacterium]|nr:rhodanese-like domain-containing protein [Candidatus Omnitrophota bacterium]
MLKHTIKIKLIAVVIVILSLVILRGNKKVFGNDAQIAKAPQMTITPEAWDFGKVTELKTQTHNFEVKNMGNEVLSIKNVSTTCNCTKAEISKNKLEPGETAELKVSFEPDLTNAKGKIKRNIYIESNDPQQATKIISILLELDTNLKPRSPVAKSMSPYNLLAATQPPKLSSKKLYERIQKGEKVVILDVREENEYIGKHIPDAIWFPKSKFDRQDLEVLKKLEKIDRNTIVVTYCGAGHRSNYVAKKLIDMGYNAYNLDGISFWEKENLPLVRGPKMPPTQEPSIILLEEAYQNYYLLFKDVVWVDVRENEDYQRGHVKGALGIPLPEIESRLKEIPQDKEIVFYCEGTWDGGSCEASRSAGRILIKNGYKQGNIKVFEDGYGAWENAGYPAEKERS